MLSAGWFWARPSRASAALLKHVVFYMQSHFLVPCSGGYDRGDYGGGGGGGGGGYGREPAGYSRLAMFSVNHVFTSISCIRVMLYPVLST